ncbi:MAG: T9SS type A sorting domain-containing protein [Flavobacteriales bacterium]|nr:T9SS type A sorting domain-containing protein [Flavobacteriales bacterium]
MRSAIITTILSATCAITLSAQFAPGMQIASDVPDVQELHVVDLNGDQNLDLIVLQSNSIGWFANEGEGNFSPLETIYSTDGWLGAFDFADIQGDGSVDLLIVERDTAILMLVNDGLGHFGTPELLVSIEVGGVGELKGVDLISDSLPEVMYATSSSGIQVLPNDNGSFGSAQNLMSALITNGPIFWDMDGDGDQDFMVEIGLGFDTRVGLNPGVSGEPWTMVYIPGLLGRELHQLLDADGDGDKDVVIIQSRVRILEHDFEQGFVGSFNVYEISGISSFFQRRGWASSLGCGPGVSIFWRDTIGATLQWTSFLVGSGFAPVQSLSDLPSPEAIHSGDLDGDGREDLILWHTDSVISWYRNTLEPPQTIPFETMCLGTPAMLFDNVVTPGGSWSGIGVVNNVFAVADTGAYTVYYTVVDTASGCPITESQLIEVSLCTSIDLLESDISTLQVYPSPATTFVTINGQYEANVQFIDAAGRISLSVPNVQPRTPIDIRFLESGLYTVIATTQNEQQVGRVLIE